MSRTVIPFLEDYLMCPEIEEIAIEELAGKPFNMQVDSMTEGSVGKC